jgi:hypothetical protein
MVRVLGLLFLGVIVLALIGTNKSNQRSGSGRQAVSPYEFEQCRRRGIEYYKDIGSYPILSTGKIADEKIAIACNRSAKIF